MVFRPPCAILRRNYHRNRRQGNVTLVQLLITKIKNVDRAIK